MRGDEPNGGKVETWTRDKNETRFDQARSKTNKHHCRRISTRQATRAWLDTLLFADRLPLSGERSPMTEDLILVNEQNRAIGRAEKRAVHEAGLLHRAFSIFLIDAKG